MKYTNITNKVLILAFLAIFFLLYSPKFALASHEEDFDSYTVGDIDGQGDWSVVGVTANGTVQTAEHVTHPNGMGFNASSNLGANYVEYDYTPDQEIWYMYMKVDIGGGNTTCLAFTNASSTIHTWFCIEADGSVYINGLDTAKDVGDEEWNLYYLETSATSSRIKINNGSFSSWKAYAVTPKVTDTVRFSTNNISNTTYIDNFGDQHPTTDQQAIDDFFGYDFSAQIETVNSLTCFTEEDCNIWFSYNSEALGGTVWLTPNESPFVENYIDNTTVTISSNGQNKVVLPAESNEGTDEICLLLTGVGTDQAICGIDILWIASTTFSNALNRCSIDTVCSNVATSTGSYWDDFRYGIECGFRRFTCWSLTPEPETINNLNKSISGYYGQFPISVFKQLESAYRRGYASSTAGFSVNLKLDEIGFNEEIFNTNYPSQTFGTSTWTSIRNGFGYFVYLLTAIYFIYILLGSRKKE